MLLMSSRILITFVVIPSTDVGFIDFYTPFVLIDSVLHLRELTSINESTLCTHDIITGSFAVVLDICT
jgi:hypothetical protein